MPDWLTRDSCGLDIEQATKYSNLAVKFSQVAL